jgi:hypothetical protein
MTDLSPREKELVEAVREMQAFHPYELVTDATRKVYAALRAYDPPKREYAIPSWEELSKEQARKIGENYPLSKGFDAFYMNIREITSKEVKP